MADSPQPEVLEYQQLRFIVGGLGVAFPFALAVGSKLTDGHWMQPSLSQYYCGSMQDLFVGTLTAIGVFLLSYLGSENVTWLPGAWLQATLGRFWWAKERALQWATGPSAILVAFFSVCDHPIAHYTCASLFFFCISAYAMAFRNSSLQGPMRTVFMVCAAGVVGSVAAVLFCEAVNGVLHRRVFNSIVYPESLGVISFGVAWLVKSELAAAEFARPLLRRLNLVEGRQPPPREGEP